MEIAALIVAIVALWHQREQTRIARINSKTHASLPVSESFPVELDRLLRSHGLRSARSGQLLSEQMSDRLIAEVRAYVLRHLSSSRIPENKKWRFLAEGVLFYEAQFLLGEVNPTSIDGALQRLSEIESDEYVARRLPEPEVLSDIVPRYDDFDLRKGLYRDEDVDRYLRDREPLRVIVPYPYVAELILFWHLKYERQVPLQIDYQAITFNQYVALLEQGRDSACFDLCVGVDAAAGRLLRIGEERRYHLIDILTGLRNRVMAPGPATAIEQERPFRGEFSALLSDWSTAQQVYQYLQQKGLVPSTGKARAIDADDGATRLASGDPEQRVIVWSPYWQIYTLLGLGHPVRDPEAHRHFAHVMLFASDRLLRESDGELRIRTLLSLLRASWLELSRDQYTLMKMAEAIAGEQSYLDWLQRFGNVDQWNFGLMSS